jgi:N-methylhydantoinase A
VRDYPMVAFGGSGPLLVCRLMDILGLPAVIVPENPGNLSAFGLLTVDVKNDYVQTYVARDTELDPAAVAGVLADLERQATVALDREGFDATVHRLVRSADLRYYGQAFEVRVAAPEGPIDADFRAEVVRRFQDEHERLYGYCYRDDPRHPVEWVNLRVSGIGPIKRPELTELPWPVGAASTRPAFRRVFFEDELSEVWDDSGWQECSVHQREELRRGDLVAGPAVIEEFGSTLPVHPGFAATVDAYGNLIVARFSAGTNGEITAEEGQR